MACKPLKFLDVKFRGMQHEKSRPEAAKSLKRNGAQGRNRTTDTRIFSPLLYQLSYLGPGKPGRL